MLLQLHLLLLFARPLCVLTATTRLSSTAGRLIVLGVPERGADSEEYADRDDAHDSFFLHGGGGVLG